MEEGLDILEVVRKKSGWAGLDLGEDVARDFGFGGGWGAVHWAFQGADWGLAVIVVHFCQCCGDYRVICSLVLFIGTREQIRFMLKYTWL